MTVAPNDAVAQGLWGKQGAAANPQELNRYSYVNNNPVNATDPTGHFLDTLLDIAFIAYDVYDIAANGYTAEKGLALAADVGGALIPGLTGAGTMVRAAAHADDVVDAVKVVSSAADAVKAACSFPADTPVLTADGAEAISDVDVGEQVVAWNEATGTTGIFTVTASWAHLDPIIVMLTLDGERIEATPEHPFYVMGKGWTLAEQLQPGDAVQQADGTPGTVDAVQMVQRPQVMYNLTVDTAHTYFVGQGQWLVHNACGGRGSNHLKSADGAVYPHTTFRRDPQTGEINHYEVWEPNPRNPSGFDSVKRVDITGDAHYNKQTKQRVPTPHVNDKKVSGGVRPAQPDEIPRRR